MYHRHHRPQTQILLFPPTQLLPNLLIVLYSLSKFKIQLQQWRPTEIFPINNTGAALDVPPFSLAVNSTTSSHDYSRLGLVLVSIRQNLVILHHFHLLACIVTITLTHFKRHFAHIYFFSSFVIISHLHLYILDSGLVFCFRLWLGFVFASRYVCKRAARRSN
jgi:hypothetical protein